MNELDPLGPAAEPVIGETASPDRVWLPLAIGAVLIGVLVAVFVIAADEQGASDDEATPRDESQGEFADDEVDLDDPTDPYATNLVDEEVPTTTAPTPRLFGRLDFAGVGELEPGRIVGMADLGDSRFVFTDPTESSGPFGGVGFDRILAATERTADGEWIRHGAVLDGIDVRGVTQHGDEVVVVGMDADRRGALWRSADGITWTVESLPLFKSLEGEPLEPHAVAANGETIVIRAQQPDDWLRFDRALAEAGLTVDTTAGWRFIDGRVDVLGPFNFVIDTIDLTAIGIEPPTPNGPLVTTNAWVGESQAWQLVSNAFEGDDLVTDADGAFLRRALDGSGYEVSADGDDWRAESPPGQIDGIHPVADGLLAWNEEQLWRLGDDGQWADTTVPFPSGRPSQVVDARADGDTIAAVIEREVLAEPEGFAILHDGFLVRFAGDQLLIALEQDGTITHEVTSGSPGDDHRFDPQTGLTFLDPATGEPVTTVPMDLLTFAFDEFLREQLDTGLPRTSILVSGEDDIWTWTPVERIRSSGATLAEVTVHDGVVTAFVIPSDDPNLRGELAILVYEAAIDG